MADPMRRPKPLAAGLVRRLNQDVTQARQPIDLFRSSSNCCQAAQIVIARHNIDADSFSAYAVPQSELPLDD